MEEKCKSSYFKKFIFTLFINFTALLTFLFFGPLEIFLGNAIEFSFSFNNVWWIMLLTSFGLSLIMALIESLFSAKVLMFFNAFAVSCALSCYIQTLLLNGSMGTLTGENDSYSNSLVIGNLTLWAIIFIVVFVLCILSIKFSKENLYKTGIIFAVIAITVMQLSSFVVSVINKEDVKSIKGSYISVDGQFELAKKDNVVCFLIDTCDNNIVEQAKKEFSDLFDGLNGFTYFPNAVSMYSRTYPAVPYLMTGTKCYFDKPYADYIAEAYDKGHFLNDLKNNGTDVRLFTESNYVSGKASKLIDNFVTYDNKSLSSISIKGLIKQCIIVSAYRELPYAFKENFKYTSASVNQSVNVLPSEQAAVEDDYGFYQNLKNKGISVNEDYKSSYRFYHFFGTHPGYQLNENAELSPTTQGAALKGCLKIIGEYIDGMKKAGIFDNSTIIITADHGDCTNSDDLSLPNPASPIMIVKPAGVNSNEKMKTNMAPVCHDDLFASTENGAGIENSSYGKNIFGIKENENRVRYHNHTALYSDEDGEVVLREYEVNGDARSIMSYKPTGKYWDINYSERAVSKNRYSDIK